MGSPVAASAVKAILYHDMSRTYLDRDTPIAALATPPGRSALGVIRTSGNHAIDLVAACFSRPSALRGAHGYQAVHGWLLDPSSGERIDEVVALVFRAPHSFTGEDSVEIMFHGSPAIAEKIMQVLEAHGFARALHGEFTFRAFAAGKADLVQAEAINELTHASCEAARKDALLRLSGALSERLQGIRSSMLACLADIDARLDYPDDESPDEDLRVAALLDAMIHDLDTLLSGADSARLRQEGLLVVIAGRPNAGKSSLFNLLVREERAIVSPEPGTTRDWLESWITIGEYAVRLVDTAGIRHANDHIEAEGVRRAESLVARADLMLYLVDGTCGLSDEDLEFLNRHPDAFRLWNKTDMQGCMPPPEGWLSVSTKNLHGFPAFEASLLRKLAEKAGDTARNQHESQVRVASERQAAELRRCRQALMAARTDFSAGLPLDMVAVHLRDAATAIGELTGEITSDEILETVFGTFCLGK